MAPDGQPAGFGDFRVAEKAIPRENLPPGSAIAWNRLRIAAMAALSGESSATVRLAAEADVITRLTAATKIFLDHWICGDHSRTPVPRRLAQAIQELQDLERLGNTLPAPVLPVSLGVTLERIADPRHAVDLPPTSTCADIPRLICSNLAPRLLRFDEPCIGLAAFTRHLLQRIRDLANRVDWELMDNPPFAQFDELASALSDLHDILVDAASTDDDSALLRLRQAATGRHPLAAAAEAARRSTADRDKVNITRLRAALTPTAERPATVLDVFASDSTERDGVTWPTHQVAVLVRTDDPLDVLRLLPSVQEARREALAPYIELTLLGAMGGRLVPALTFKVSNESAFPAPDDTEDWKEETAMDLLESPLAAAANEAIAAIATLSALHLLNSKRDLQPIERALVDQAEADLDRATRLLEASAEDQQTEIRGPEQGEGSGGPLAAIASIRGWLEVLRDEEELAAGQREHSDRAAGIVPGFLADRLIRIIRGEYPEFAAELFFLRFGLMAYDVDPAFSKLLAREWNGG
jgi:hypothetical protein